MARAAAIFGHAPAPRRVWQRQFDGDRAALERLAGTSQWQIREADLYRFVDDLNWVPRLQPDLFRYLFPVCLHFWADTLMANRPFIANPGGDFHRALLVGRVLERMATPEERTEVWRFFRDAMLDRLDEERGFRRSGEPSRKFSDRANAWLIRFNTLGLLMPGIGRLWNEWWRLETPGRAVAALEYASGLVYIEGMNPMFEPWTPDEGGGGPYLWDIDAAIYDHGWREDNVRFLAKTLTTEYLRERLARIVEVLRDQPEEEMALRVQRDFEESLWIVEPRLLEQPKRLETLHLDGVDDWHCEGYNPEML